MAPVGQGPLLPTVQETTGTEVGVAMHWPPHGFPVAQMVVGVHVDAVGQGPLLPTVQGMTGGKVCEVTQRPPQTWVWVQVEPKGQGSPPTIQVDEGGLAAVAFVARVVIEKMKNRRKCIFVEVQQMQKGEERVWLFLLLGKDIQDPFMHHSSTAFWVSISTKPFHGAMSKPSGSAKDCFT